MVWSVFNYLVAVLVMICKCHCSSLPPNIIMIITDDQDVELGGLTPMPKLQKLIGDKGVRFANAFATSPLCCPSRSSILTGNYVHNNGAVNNSLSGNCSSRSWQKTAELNTFAVHLHDHHYRTFYAGKYLNQYGFKAAGGVEHIPPGWDEWNGLVGNSEYYNYSLSVNGVEEKHGDDYAKDYLTDVISRRAVSFIEKQRKQSEPFMMMLSTPSCHSPFIPAPQYNSTFSDVKAPRNGSFNTYSEDRHWLARSVKHPLGDESIKLIDDVYRNRWRTLLSVDDMVENVDNVLTKHDLINNTFIFFMSDHGYHLGQLSLPYDKRQMYEFDIRVPLMVRGPGIKPGQVRKDVILNIDLAPTFIDLATSSPTSSPMDGQSFKSILLSNESNNPSGWRTEFLVEHSGEFEEIIPGCPNLNNQRVSNCYPECVCEDSKNNTYGCVRVINGTVNMIYCQFADDEDFVEVYDLNTDPFQLKNIARLVDPKLLVEFNKKLLQLSVCSGPSCYQSSHYTRYVINQSELDT